MANTKLKNGWYLSGCLGVVIPPYRIDHSFFEVIFGHGYTKGGWFKDGISIKSGRSKRYQGARIKSATFLKKLARSAKALQESISFEKQWQMSGVLSVSFFGDDSQGYRVIYYDTEQKGMQIILKEGNYNTARRAMARAKKFLNDIEKNALALRFDLLQERKR